MSDFVQWMTSNWQVVMTALTALWAAVSVVVAATPTVADDAALGRVRAVLERLSVLQPVNSPGVMSLPGAKARRPPD